MEEKAGPLPPVVFLMGPTASGKTELALALSDLGSFEIVSVDSMLVYQGMDIGTAKPDAATLNAYPHHLVDIRDPADPYSAAEFCRDARELLDDITARNRIPLLVGGTMMYFKLLKDGMAEMPSADAEIRKMINDLAEREGWAAVHARLQLVDPVTAQRLKPGDSQRLQRALEVYELTGVPISDLQARKTPDLPYRLCQLALIPADRALLHQRIEQRFITMLASGWIDEVRALRRRADLKPHLPAMRATGYQQILSYLDGNLDYKQMLEKGIIATRQLAKRQLIWLKAWPDLHSLDPLSPDMNRRCLQILKRGAYL